MERISKENYYLNIAETVLERSTCLRRLYGAIIVKNDEIISTGYNGAPRGRANCSDLGYCSREAMKIPRGERYELCRSVHAEANAIILRSPAGYGGRHYLSGGPGRQNPCAALRRHLLPHVPAAGDQRRIGESRDSQDRDGV